MFEKSTNAFYKSNPSEIFSNPAYGWIDDNDKYERRRVLKSNSTDLTSTSSSSEINVNAKLIKHGQTKYFLVNAFTLILIHLAAWILVLVGKIIKKLCSPLKENSILENIYYLLCYNIVIFVFVLTA